MVVKVSLDFRAGVLLLNCSSAESAASSHTQYKTAAGGGFSSRINAWCSSAAPYTISVVRNTVPTQSIVQAGTPLCMQGQTIRHTPSRDVRDTTNVQAHWLSLPGFGGRGQSAVRGTRQLHRRPAPPRSRCPSNIRNRGRVEPLRKTQ